MRSTALIVALVLGGLGVASESTMADSAPGVTAQVVVSGLSNPAMFTVAPDGRIFYAEVSTGRIGVFTPASGAGATYFQVPNMCSDPDQGLFGLALAPNFPAIDVLYAYATRRGIDGTCQNQVLEIAPTSGGSLGMTVLLSDPYVAGHIGGRLRFGPDGDLYVSTGDGASNLATLAAAQTQREEAQKLDSLKGKILRMTPTGGVPAGNAFGNYVFAYGFRNVFGFDFDPSTGALWATDNGPEGDYPGQPAGPGPLGGCNDELDRVVMGDNYGWGPTGNCGTPPPAPLNTNQDGPNPVLPALNIVVSSGITGARFCSACGLGTRYEGNLFYAKYDYRDGYGGIYAASLSSDRSGVVSNTLVYQPNGPAPLSIERGPDGTLYYSDPTSIYKLVPSGGGAGGGGAHMTLSETASPTAGTAPLGVTYTYQLVNDGSQTLFHAGVNDTACSSPAYKAGDTNNDQLLQPGETWTFTCAKTYTTPGTYTDTATAGATSTQTGLPATSNQTQATITVSTGGAGGGGGGAGAHMTLSETATPTSGTAPLGVTYTYQLVNDGSQTLFHAGVNDTACSSPAYKAGDTNNDQLLQPGETWTFTCAKTYTTPGTYTDTATAGATSTQTGLPATSNQTQATITISTGGAGGGGGGAGAHMTLSETATPTSGTAPLGVTYTYQLVNDGSQTLFHAGVNDTACSSPAYKAGDTNNDQLLQPGETWTFTCAKTYTTPGTYTDTATAGATSTQTGLPATSNQTQSTITAS